MQAQLDLARHNLQVRFSKFEKRSLFFFLKRSNINFLKSKALSCFQDKSFPRAGSWFFV
jgi:hypothetical protein